MIRRIAKCKQCKPCDDDCSKCGKQGYFGSCDDLECVEYGHGSNQCTRWVSNEEIEKHNKGYDMQKLNVRFKPETSKLIENLSKKHNVVASKVARDAITIGLGIMNSKTGYVSHSDFFKSPEEIANEMV